jgi:hypothetical protein
MKRKIDLFSAYLTTLFQLSPYVMKLRIFELGSMCKEGIVANFELVFQHFYEGAEYKP